MEETKSTITLRLEPENQTLEIPRPKTVIQLLHRLNLRPTSCLVIREPGRDPLAESGERALLTPDLKIFPGDVITVRKVTSSG